MQLKKGIAFVAMLAWATIVMLSLIVGLMLAAMYPRPFWPAVLTVVKAVLIIGLGLIVWKWIYWRIIHIIDPVKFNLLSGNERALQEKGKKIVHKLIEAVETQEGQVRLTAICALSGIPDPRAEESLVRLIEKIRHERADFDPCWKRAYYAAIKTLSVIRTSSALATLRDIATDTKENALHRMLAVKGLEKAGDSATVVATSLDIARDKKLVTYTAQREAIWALGRAKDSRAFETLRDIVLDEEEDKHKRGEAANALGWMPDDRVIPTLNGARKREMEREPNKRDFNFLREIECSQFDAVQRDRSIERLREILNNHLHGLPWRTGVWLAQTLKTCGWKPDPNTREEVYYSILTKDLKTLSQISPPALEFVTEFLENMCADGRPIDWGRKDVEQMAEVLVKIGDRRAKPALEKLLTWIPKFFYKYTSDPYNDYAGDRYRVRNPFYDWVLDSLKKLGI